MTDNDWAAIIKWLNEKGLVLVIPISEPAYLTDRYGTLIRKF